MQIVVIGGTGLIGSKLVAELQKRGHDAIAAAPSTGVDTITGEGLADAMLSAEVVVDVSNSPSFDGDAALAFFETSVRNIAKAEAEGEVGVRHHVTLSVVGTDQMQDSGYFRAKLVQEQQVAKSPIAHTIVRATQFFEFLRGIAQFSTVDGAVRLPPVQFQPMAADDIARLLADVALGNPANGIVEIAGPVRSTLDEPVRRVLAFDGDGREVIADPSAPYFGIQVSERTLVPHGDARLGTIDFDWWLEHAPPPPAR